MPEWFDLLLHGGNIGFIAFAVWLGVKFNARLNREDSLKRDYPPHRHLGQQIIFPREYEPGVTQRLNPEKFN